MRSLLAALTAATMTFPLVAASVIPNFMHMLEDLQDIGKRCDNACGYYGQVCCPADATCGTNSNDEAICVVGASSPQTAAAGSWQYITTTYVQTDLQTITTVLSSFVPSATGGQCAYSKGETECGSVCCAAGEFCESSGKCKDAGSGSSGLYSSLYTVTTVVNTAEPPLRPTSDTVVIVTATGTAGEITTTQGFILPTGTNGAITAEPQDGGGGGLSAGAIAGIVIGVLAAIIILILICLCCCAKGVLDAILGIFGLGGRKRKEREEVEIYESHHHRGGSRRGRSTSVAPGKRTWFGMGPRKTEVTEEKKKTSGWQTGAGVAAFLGGLALILGLKRRRDRKDDKSSVGYGSSYYSDYTSSTESSSDRRTRRSSRGPSRSRSRAYSASRASRR